MRTASYLMNRLHDPIDARVASNGDMLWVDKDHLKIFVGRILIYPIRVEDSQICSSATHSLLSSRFQRPLVFELVHPLVRWLACRNG